MATNQTKNKGGRPPAADGPKMPHDEVERLLVEGELTTSPAGDEIRLWPSQRELATRYGVASSLVNVFAKKINAKERRRAFQAGLPAPEPEPPKPSPAPRRKAGRPRKGDAPQVPYEEVDRLLVFGEIVESDQGLPTTVYPTHRQLAERYGVAHSIIAEYAKSRNCMKRRTEAKTRLTIRTEEKLIEERSTAFAVGKDEVIRMIDTYLLQFEEALREKRVRADNPTDVNTMARLKEFLLGGADSRQELHGSFTLEALQQRYARAAKHVDPELAGDVEGEGTPAKTFRAADQETPSAEGEE